MRQLPPVATSACRGIRLILGRRFSIFFLNIPLGSLPRSEILMKSCCRLAVFFQLLFVCIGLSQVPSVQLKVRASSGFLGLGGARFVELRLANEGRLQPLTSENVNAGPFYYFECLPVGGWEFDQDFVKDILSRISVEQNTLHVSAGYVSDITQEGGSSSVVIGFSKSVKIQDPFLFRVQSGDVQYQGQFTIPVEFWPGYEIIENLYQNAERALAANRFREAISFLDAIIANDAYQVFPQRAKSQTRIVETFQAYLDATTSAFQLLKDTAGLDPRKRIARIAQFRPMYMFVVDSLPPLQFKLGSLDSRVTGLLDQARKGVLRIGLVTDSLQNALDEQTVRWVLDGSVTGRAGAQYQDVIGALAYAFSSMNFADTNAMSLPLTIPDEIRMLLEKNNLAESYKTFVRVCSDRHQMHLALFPVDFLPNLRKDTAVFPLPYYSMLKAVSDYFAGNLSSCNEEIRNIFRSCYVRELLERFDKLRVIVYWKSGRVPANVFRLLAEGTDLESKGQYREAAEQYRQAVILAPEYAYASYSLGRLDLVTGDTTVGIGLLHKAYQLDTLFLSAYLDSYDVLQQRQNYKGMIDVMLTALARGND